jgi:hypothetical protein
LEELGVCGRITEKQILMEWSVMMWTGFICLRRFPMMGYSANGNELSGTIKGT